MEKLSLSELRTVLKSIERALECSVCLECIRGTAVICQNGHGVCEPCAEHLHDCCPLCRKSYSNINPTMLNSVIRLLPRPCQHVDNGCEKLILPSTSYDHEQLCGYRNDRCWLKSCDWVGLVDDTLNHLQGDHRNTEVYTDQTKVVKWPASLLRSGGQTFNPVYAFSMVIWARASVSANNDVHITFHIVPNKVVPSLMAVVSFVRGSILYTNTVPVINKKPDCKVSENEGIHLPSDKVKTFTTAAGALVHSLEIIKPI